MYVNSINRFDKIIIGVSKKEDIDRILKFRLNKKFSKNEIEFIEQNTKNFPKIFFTPSFW